ncbi:MAG: serine/threonine-protein kinase [Planctomycetia bacterium]
MNPTQLGPYTIQSRLGRGGMGAVYEAYDTTTGKTVAVKVLASHLADDHGLRQRFDAEIDALKNLRHPGIVRLIAFGEQDDQPYFAMELVRGKSLEQTLRSGRRFTWRETVAMAIEITRALKAAHDQGIVHRDLKPANLLVMEPQPDTAAGQSGSADAAATNGGDGITVKLADFGIAKLFGGVGHTALGHVVGTAEYMAPEQAAGRPVDHRVDLYALGLVMYACLTGGPPFRGTQLTEVIDKQKRAIAPRVKSLVRDVPEELDELIARLLSKDPAQRPASALALGRLLQAIQTLHPPTDDLAASPPAVPAASPAPRGGSLPPTALERSKKPTRLDDLMAATGPAIVPGEKKPTPAATPRVDLLAPTQAVPAAAPPAADNTRRPTMGSTAITQDFTDKAAAAGVAAAAPSRLSTDVASASTLVDRGPSNRFTTVEQYERDAAARERREQRRQLLWQMLTAAVAATMVAWGGYLLLRPHSADDLYERIDAAATDEHGDLRDVRDDIAVFLAKHASDPRAGRVREIGRTLELDTLERRARRRLRSDKAVTPLERDYRAAISDEEHGPSACVKALEAMLAVYAKSGSTDGGPAAGGGDEDSLWLDLARRQLDRLRPRAEAERRDDAKRLGELLAEAGSLAARAEIANDAAAKQKFAAQRQGILANIVEVYAERPHAAEAVAFAKRELAAADAPNTSPSPPASAPVTTSPPATD